MPLTAIATTTEWTGAANDHNWFNATNWDMGVPGLLDTAIVGTDSVNITGVVDIKYLEVKDLARLVISPNGKLRILNSDGVGILCIKSTIYNYGLIRVFNSGAEGIIVSGDSQLFNFMGSNLFIQSSGSYPSHIRLGGRLLNFPGSEMRIDSCFGSLLNDGILLNRGEIGIYISETTAIFNNGCITNEGVIRIDSTGSTGLVNGIGAIINNSDSLIISRVNDEINGISPLLNGDSIKNMLGGVILIQNSNNLYGYNNRDDGTTINNGSLIIRDQKSGVNIEGEGFYNNGLVDIQSTSLGIRILSKLMNEDLGEIVISSDNDDTAAGTGIMVSFGGALTNYGDILLEDEFFIALDVSGGRVENYDSLKIIVTNAFRSLINRDTFYNFQDGVLIIDNSDGFSSGLSVENSNEAYFVNEGQIQISAINNTCLQNLGTFVNDSLTFLTSNNAGVVNNGLEFTNSINGHIIVQNANHSIKNDSIMLNLGNIMIDSVGDTGLENTCMLTNEGKISITNVLEIGVQNSGILINKDSIVIDEIQEIGLVNTDSLYLDTSSVIIVSNTESLLTPNFIQNEGSLTNHGKITIDVMESSTTGGNGIHCLPSSFWFNSTSSELIVQNFDSIIDWMIIDVGAEFSDSGVITMD